MPIGFISAQLEPRCRLPTGRPHLPAERHRGLGTGACWGVSATGTLAALRGPARLRRAIRPVGASRCRPAAMITSWSSNGPRQRSRARSRSSARCRRAPGLEATTYGCGSVSTGAARSSPTRGYVGISVHAAARICFAAHGGQVVMSSAVRGAFRAARGRHQPGRTSARGDSAASPSPLPCSRSRPRTCRPTSRRCDRPSAPTRAVVGSALDERRDHRLVEAVSHRPSVTVAFATAAGPRAGCRRALGRWRPRRSADRRRGLEVLDRVADPDARFRVMPRARRWKVTPLPLLALPGTR